MIDRILLFPKSNYLAKRWWHRLSTVIFWAWLVTIITFSFKTFIVEPFSTCLRVKFMVPAEPNDLNCGSNAFDYAWTNASAEPLENILLTGAFLIVVFYIAAILPSLLYRVLLYVVKGSNWRDSASAT